MFLFILKFLNSYNTHYAHDKYIVLSIKMMQYLILFFDVLPSPLLIKKKQNYSILYYSTICLKCDQRKWKLHTAKALLIVGGFKIHRPLLVDLCMYWLFFWLTWFSLDIYGRVKKLTMKPFQEEGLLGKMLKYSLLFYQEMSSNQGLTEILNPQPLVLSDVLSMTIN